MRTRRAIVAAAALAIGLLAGCSSGTAEQAEVATADNAADSDTSGSTDGSGTSDDSSGSGGEPPAQDREERQLQFTNCMREQGVDIPDSNGEGIRLRTGNGVDREDLEAAMEACRQYAPGGEEGMRMSEEDKQKMRDFVQCMRDQGIEIGDPDPSTGMPPAEDMRKIFGDESDQDPTVTDAKEACEEHRPGRIMVTR